MGRDEYDETWRTHTTVDGRRILEQVVRPTPPPRRDQQPATTSTTSSESSSTPTGQPRR